MSQSFRDPNKQPSFVRWLAEKFKANFAEENVKASVADPVGVQYYPRAEFCTHSETVNHMLPNGGSIIQCMKCSKQWRTTNLGQVPEVVTPSACTHPGINIHRETYDGPSTYTCRACGKQWDNLPDAIAESEQTQPMNMDVADEHGIDPVVSNLANEMGIRMADTLRHLVEATAGTVTTPQPTLRQPLPMQPGTTAAYFGYSPASRSQTPSAEGDINEPRQDPKLVQQQHRMNAAQMVLRKKMMEEAARAAAAAFDMGEAHAPVKLDGDRKLKVVS